MGLMYRGQVCIMLSKTINSVVEGDSGESRAMPQVLNACGVSDVLAGVR